MIAEDKISENSATEIAQLRRRGKELEGALTRYNRIDHHLEQLGNMIHSKHPLNTLLSLLPIGVSICLDPACKEIRHNPAAAKLLRIKDWEVLSHSADTPPPVRILRNGKELSPEQMPIQRCIWNGEMITNEELEIVWEDGITKSTCWQGTPLYNAAGSVVGAVAISVDITEKNQRLELENIADGFFLLNAHYHLIYISPKAELLVGKSSEKLIGRSIWEILLNYFGREVYERFYELTINRMFTALEVYSHNKKQWFEITSVLGDAGMYLVFRDITPRKATEERQQINLHRLASLLQLSQMRDANLQEITDFTYEAGIRLTGSKVGWLGLLDQQETTLELKSHSEIPPFLKQNLSCSNPITFAVKSAGFWAEAIRQRRPIIIKNYQADSPLKKGLPKGHMELERCLIVPIVDQERVVAVFGVANKETEYEESDIYQLSLLTSGMWDILKKRDAAKKLRSSEEKFHTAFHSSPVAMAISDLQEQRFIDVNDTWLHLFGYTRKEVICAGITELNLWADPKTLDRIRSRLEGKRNLYNYEVEFYTKAGLTGTGVASFQFISIDGRDCISSSIIDITERKQAEYKLRSSEERFLKIFHSSPVMMAILSMKDNRFIEVNQTYIDQMGYTREETIGHTLMELDIWADSHTISQCINKLEKAQGKFDNLECDIRSQSGKIITVLASIDLIELNNEKCRLIVLQNITEKKLIEANLARMDRLNLVGEMAASIGHELRNPMTTIRGFLQMLKAWEGPQEWREYSDLIIEELDRANAIITEFLSLAKNKAVTLKEAALTEVVDVMLPLIRSNCLARDMDVVIEHHETSRVLLDEHEIRQLLLNFSRNALDAMSPGGILTIRTYQEYNDVVLSIQDQGSGIKEEIMDKLGTPFVTTKEDGTGLGLAVCYSIAERHNAVINVKTGPYGTNFMVRFPSAEPGRA